MPLVDWEAEPGCAFHFGVSGGMVEISWYFTVSAGPFVFLLKGTVFYCYLNWANVIPVLSYISTLTISQGSVLQRLAYFICVVSKTL